MFKRLTTLPSGMLGDAPVRPVLATRDLARMQMFYQEQLGLRVKEQRADQVMLESGDTTLMIFRHPDAKPSARTVIGWEVKDARKTLKELAARGVQIEQYAEGRYKTDVDGVTRTSEGNGGWFRDVDGNYCAVFEKP